MARPLNRSLATDAAEARRVIDYAALNQDPDAAERRIGSLFERHGEAQLPADESPLKLYGSLRIHAIRNGTGVSGEDQSSGFSLGDGGSRIGARLQHTFGQATAMFGRLEAGFNILDVFSSNASSGDDGERRALNPRLYYVAFDSPYAYASYGKNWSTYYQIAGTTDRFAAFGGDTSGVFNAGTDGGASGTGRRRSSADPAVRGCFRQAADKALQPQHAVPARPAYSPGRRRRLWQPVRRQCPA